MLVPLHNLGQSTFYIHVASLELTPSFVAYENPPTPIHLPLHFQHIVRHDQHSNRHAAIHYPHLILEDSHSLHIILHDHC
jgi:hypothetical protein